jgi:hypothetical protein
MGGVDIFDCGNLELASAKGSIPFQLTSLSNRKNWSTLRSNFTALLCGSLCLEVAALFAVEGYRDSDELFEPLILTLTNVEELAADSLSKAKLYREAGNFLLKVLQIAGLDPLEGTSHLPSETKLSLLDSGSEGSEERDLRALVSFTEKSVTYELRTKKALFAAV